VSNGPRAVALLLIFTACARVSPEMLDPAPEPMPQRLLPLTLGLGQEVVVPPETRPVVVQSDFTTVFSRDLEANVFLEDTLRWGYIEFRITFDDRKITGGGAALIAGNVVTLFVPVLFGAPLTIRERTLQVEVAIYDSRRVPFRTYVFDRRVKYGDERLYESRNYRHRKAGIQAAKEILQAFRGELALELAAINGRLRQVGPIPHPAPGR
jgi:hypothetical protein